MLTFKKVFNQLKVLIEYRDLNITTKNDFNNRKEITLNNLINYMKPRTEDGDTEATTSNNTTNDTNHIVKENDLKAHIVQLSVLLQFIGNPDLFVLY